MPPLIALKRLEEAARQPGLHLIPLAKIISKTNGHRRSVLLRDVPRLCHRRDGRRGRSLQPEVYGGGVSENVLLPEPPELL